MCIQYATYISSGFPLCSFAAKQSESKQNWLYFWLFETVKIQWHIQMIDPDVRAFVCVYFVFTISQYELYNAILVVELRYSYYHVD